MISKGWVTVFIKDTHDEFYAEMKMMAEPDPDDLVTPTPELSTLQTYEPDPDDEELQRINGAMASVCNRLQKALEMLKSEVSPMQSTSILQTLLKIIRYAYEQID
jgi:hypothetical protein